MDIPIDLTRRTVLRTIATGAILAPTAVANVASATSPSTTTVPLLAARSVRVGVVVITVGPRTLTVTYDTRGTAWSLGRTHLHVADSVDDIPTTDPGNPRVGRFEYGGAPVRSDGGLVRYTDLPRPPGDRLVVAAHAEVRSRDQRETAWAEGRRFVGDGRGSWAMYVELRPTRCFVLERARTAQYHQLQQVDLPDPFELQIDVVDPSGRPVTGELRVELGVTNHHGSLDDPPTSRAFTIVEDLAFEEGTAAVTIASQWNDTEVELRMPCTVGDLCSVEDIETIEVVVPDEARVTELRVCAVS